MKTGIITLVGNNYGNRLQNYAVQELLKEYGDVYTVKYEKKVPVSVKQSRFERYTPAHMKVAVDSRLLNIYHLSNRKMNTITRFIYFIKHRNDIKVALSKRDAAFREFDEKYISYEKELLHLTGDDNEEWVKSYDAWVCGSDQIWNPNYPTATRNAFLQFAPEQRRIALSASIGLSDINAMLPEYSEWMKGIPYLSVREERAAEIVEELTNKKAEVFLDPTMLIPLEKWHQIADDAHTKLPEHFAVGYFLGVREKEYMEYIQNEIGELDFVDLLNGEKAEYLTFGPDHVIEAIRNAEIVFVDSFHGAVFSILFHKQFVVFERSEKGQTMNSRLETLLKRFGLQNRVYTGNNIEALRQTIDYSCIDGVPSPKLFSDYLEYLRKEYGNGKPVSVNFRNKQRGWKRLYMEVKFDNGKRHYIYSGYDRYEGMFLNNMSLRPSCYECKFTTTKRYGDITLGDFWGIGKKYPQWDDDKGISVVMLNTEKGISCYEQIADKFDARKENLDMAKAGQRTLYAPTKKNPNRDAFYKLYAKKGCKEALERYTNVPSGVVRGYYAMMRVGLDIVRKILRKGY